MLMSHRKVHSVTRVKVTALKTDILSTCLGIVILVLPHNEAL